MRGELPKRRSGRRLDEIVRQQLDATARRCDESRRAIERARELVLRTRPSALPPGRTCAECTRCTWVLGVAGGYHCTAPQNAVDGRPARLPTTDHTCPHFQAQGTSSRP